MNYGFDEEVKQEEKEISCADKVKAASKRTPFAYWKVGGKSYQMKLTTAVICQLEDKFKCNLMNLLSSSNGMPPLAVMLTIVQGAMKPWEHGIKYARVQELFDRYCEEGGTQLTFMTEVLLPVYQVSGFFSEQQQAKMDERMEEVKELL